MIFYIEVCIEILSSCRLSVLSFFLSISFFPLFLFFVLFLIDECMYYSHIFNHILLYGSVWISHNVGDNEFICNSYAWRLILKMSDCICITDIADGYSMLVSLLPCYMCYSRINFCSESPMRKYMNVNLLVLMLIG